MSDHYVISKELLEDLVKYLFTRPCGEVLHGVLALKNLVPLEQYLKINETK